MMSLSEHSPAGPDTPGPGALQVSHLTVRFGGVTPVNDVSFTVQTGEIVGLIGPNGAGKSTLIDTISGFVRPVSGSIVLGDHDITNAPPHRRVEAGLGRSWQSLEIFEDVTVRENLRVGGSHGSWRERLIGLFAPERGHLPAPAVAAVDAFGLEPDLDRKPDELSFSQRRLVGTARALALDPRILMLDEPAAGFSDQRRKGLADAIRSFVAARGVGMLLVDHDMPFVMGLCDRLIVLNFGVKIAEGSPAEVRANPAVIAAYLRGDATASEPEPAAPPVAASPTRLVPSGTRQTLLAARNLAVGYHGQPVVRGITLDVRPGEVTALLGANRAGKTTTLLGLAGAIAPLEGETVWLGDKVERRVPVHRLAEQGFGFLSADRSVFRQLTVAENFRVGRCDLDRALALFPELGEHLTRKVGLLSGGQQQMVGLGRALAREPKVLLVDEMSLGLAPIVVTRLMDALRHAADEHGVGVVLVEQHVPQALRVSDHVCVVAGGRMTLAGAVADVGHLVDDAFLADVLGTNPDSGRGGPPADEA